MSCSEGVLASRQAGCAKRKDFDRC